MYLTSIGYTMFVSPVKWIVILAPLALVFGLSFGIERLRPATAQLLFWIFAALMGLFLGSIFMVYTHTSIVPHVLHHRSGGANYFPAQN
jgi:uncharacterized protein